MGSEEFYWDGLVEKKGAFLLPFPSLRRGRERKVAYSNEILWTGSLQKGKKETDLFVYFNSSEGLIQSPIHFTEVQIYIHNILITES